MATQPNTVISMPKVGLGQDLKSFYDARKAIDTMIRSLKAERAKAEDALVLEQTKAFAATPQPTADKVVDSVKRWKAENQQKGDKIEQLEALHSMVQERIKQLKERFPKEAAEWLKHEIGEIHREETEQKGRTRETAERAEALEKELDTLQGKPKAPEAQVQRKASARRGGRKSKGGRRKSRQS